MPPAVPLVAAVAGAAVTSAVGVGIAGSIAGALVATAVNSIGSRALTKKPKTQGFTAEAQGRSIVVRSAVESHKIVYGRAKVSGPLVFAETAGRFLHMIIPVAGHEVDGFETFYLNDMPVALDANGFVTTAPYAHQVERQVTSQVGLVSATAVYDPVRNNARITWTTAAPHGFAPGQIVAVAGMSDQRFNRIAVGFGTLGAEILTVPSPTTFTSVVGGTAFYSLAPITATGGAASRTATVTTTESYVRIRAHGGHPDQLADEALCMEVPGKWSPDHRLRGIAYLYVRLEYNADAFPTGIPNVSVVIRGKRVYDPRSGTIHWSENAALCIRDYLASDYGFACAASEVDDAYAIAAANICDEPIALPGGALQGRYACDGVVDTASAPMENLQALVTALAGAATYVQGRFRIHAAAYDAPTGAITDDMLAGGSIQTAIRTPRKDLFNAVKGTYVDPGKLWQATDFPAVTNAFYEAQDNGERIYRDIELPFTIDPVAAQRIGKLLLEKGRQGITQTLSVNHAALKHAVYDVVTRTDPQHGWVDKPFRIMNFGLAVPGPITLTFREESAASYSWNTGQATAVDTAPDTNLPSAHSVLPPGAITVTESKYITRSGDGVKALATLTWTASPDVFLREYQPEYKLRAEGVWRRLDRTDAVESVVEDIGPGVYDFRVKAVNSLGVSSIYSTAAKQVSGLSDPPMEPQNLTISTIGGLALLRWDEYSGNAALDVKIGGKIVFRHSPDEASGWAQSTTIGNAVPGSATIGVLPLKPGIYLAKAVDSSGIESASAATVVTGQATALAFANVTGLTEHPAFSGAKDEVVAIGGVLRLTGAASFSDIPLVSAAPSIALSGGVTPAGTYAFSGGIDLGTVRPVRLTSRVLAEVVNQLDTIRSRTALISSWKSFTGADAAEGDARVYVRTTDDDPAAAPAWGAWQRLDSGEFACRAVEAELRLEIYDPAYNVLVSELSLTVDEVA